jgi:hypothetical protein
MILFVVKIPEKEKDFLISCLLFRETLEKEHRKYLIGPIVDSENNRIVIFITGNPKVKEVQEKFTEYVRSNPKVHSALTHVDATHYLQEEFLQNEVNELSKQKNNLEKNLIRVMTERDDAVNYCSRDHILSKAIDNLKALKGKKKILDIALQIAEEFKGKLDAPNSIKSLLEALKMN